MRCEYCDCEVTTYPDNGICVHCGGRLPPRPTVPTPAPAPVVEKVYIPVPRQTAQPATGVRCGKCGSGDVAYVNRGFSWGLALLGFCLVPGWGLLLGFVGRKKPRLRCNSCKRKWKLK